VAGWGIARKRDRLPLHHLRTVILSGVIRALCESRSRRTCHTTDSCTPAQPFRHYEEDAVLMTNKTIESNNYGTKAVHYLGRRTLLARPSI
jgi:hypothetical protein